MSAAKISRERRPTLNERPVTPSDRGALALGEKKAARRNAAPELSDFALADTGTKPHPGFISPSLDR